MGIRRGQYVPELNLINTYVPFPFEETLAAGAVKQRRYDKQVAEEEGLLKNIDALEDLMLAHGEQINVDDYKLARDFNKKTLMDIENLSSDIYNGDKGSRNYQQRYKKIARYYNYMTGPGGPLGVLAENKKNAEELIKSVYSKEGVREQPWTATSLNQMFEDYASGKINHIDTNVPIGKYIDRTKATNDILNGINSEFITSGEFGKYGVYAYENGKYIRKGHGTGISDQKITDTFNGYFSGSELQKSLQDEADYKVKYMNYTFGQAKKEYDDEVNSRLNGVIAKFRQSTGEKSISVNEAYYKDMDKKKEEAVGYVNLNVANKNTYRGKMNKSAVFTSKGELKYDLLDFIGSTSGWANQFIESLDESLNSGKTLSFTGKKSLSDYVNDDISKLPKKDKTFMSLFANIWSEMSPEEKMELGKIKSGPQGTMNVLKKIGAKINKKLNESYQVIGRVPLGTEAIRQVNEVTKLYTGRGSTPEKIIQGGVDEKVYNLKDPSEEKNLSEYIKDGYIVTENIPVENNIFAPGKNWSMTLSKPGKDPIVVYSTGLLVKNTAASALIPTEAETYATDWVRRYGNDPISGSYYIPLDYNQYKDIELHGGKSLFEDNTDEIMNSKDAEYYNSIPHVRTFDGVIKDGVTRYTIEFNDGKGNVIRDDRYTSKKDAAKDLEYMIDIYNKSTGVN